jgi:glucokinase
VNDVEANARGIAGLADTERGRVSVGHLLSGPGLQHLYRFLSGEREAPEPAAITATAADRRSVESAAVDLFVSIYGARAGDVALAYGAAGGVFLGGGIAPRLLPRFFEGAFMEAFLAKGSLEAFLRRVPVRVILNADAALVGAALFVRDAAPGRLALAA